METEKSAKQTNSDTGLRKGQSPLLAVIRITGQVKVKGDIANTLERLKLKRKYSFSLISSNNKSLKGMLKKINYSVAYGKINKETLIKLLKARAKKLDKSEIAPEKTAEELLAGKTLKQLNFVPFFRLHPPRKGIKSKLEYPKGVLGNNKEDINKLIERML